MVKVSGMADCSVFPTASGSSKGISWKNLTSEVRVVLPEPLAPAISVSLAQVTVRCHAWLLCRLLLLTLSENLLQTLSIGSHARSSGLRPLPGDFYPIYSHGYRILCPQQFSRFLGIFIFSQERERMGHPAPAKGGEKWDTRLRSS